MPTCLYCLLFFLTIGLLPSKTIDLFSHFLSPLSLSFSSLLTPLPTLSLSKLLPSQCQPLTAAGCSNSPCRKKLSVFQTTRSWFASLSVAGIAYIMSLMTTDLPNLVNACFRPWHTPCIQQYHTLSTINIS